jgi:hypothetical protein
MSDGCTDCGRKGGCDSRKHGMFGAIDEALARLYPTRRWSDRDEDAAFGAGVASAEGEALATALGPRLRAAAFHRPGSPEETCDWIYVLCVGREPSLFELREGRLSSEVAAATCASIAAGPVRETYLRVALSTLARFGAVQEVELQAALESGPDGGEGGDGITITETPRAGVFSPPLLKRMQGIVAALVEHDIRHLDFGEIDGPPAGFDPGDYGAYNDGVPGIANYLFYPQSPAAIVTVTVGWTP